VPRYAAFRPNISDGLQVTSFSLIGKLHNQSVGLQPGFCRGAALSIGPLHRSGREGLGLDRLAGYMQLGFAEFHAKGAGLQRSGLAGLLQAVVQGHVARQVEFLGLAEPRPEIQRARIGADFVLFGAGATAAQTVYRSRCEHLDHRAFGREVRGEFVGLQRY